MPPVHATRFCHVAALPCIAHTLSMRQTARRSQGLPVHRHVAPNEQCIPALATADLQAYSTADVGSRLPWTL